MKINNRFFIKSINKITSSSKLAFLLILVCGILKIETALADSSLLDLILTGPNPTTGQHQLVLTQQPFMVNVHLINTGEAKESSQLRFFIHQANDEDEDSYLVLQKSDVKVEVREESSWITVPVELSDDSILGAIGTPESKHKSIYPHNSFSIPSHSDKSWQIRITFRQTGKFQLVMTVSPDNGNTQLAHPAFLALEVL